MSYGASIQTNVPACRIYKSTNFSCPSGAFTVVTPFDTERWDTDNMHDLATNPSRITIRTAGKYYFHGQAVFAPASPGLHRILTIPRNGGSAIGSSGNVTGSMGTGAQRVEVASTWDCVVGDYFELFAYQDSGSACLLNSEGSPGPEFEAIYLGPGLTGRGITNLTGTYLNRPAANTMPVGSTYFATDTLGTWLSDGLVWTLVNQRAAFCTSAMLNAAPFNTPYQDQEIILFDATPNFIWHFRYNAGDGGRDKWYFIGGAEWMAVVEAADTSTWAGYADLPNGPLITVPRTGIYNVRYGAIVNHSAAGSTCYLAITGSAFDHYNMPPSGGYVTMGRAGVWNVAAGTVARLQVAGTAGTASWAKRHLSIVPVKIS
jgi:hypothetical protein